MLSSINQIYDELVALGFVPRRVDGQIPPQLNTNASNVNVIRALTLVGLDPNIAIFKVDNLPRWRTKVDDKAFLNRFSVNSSPDQGHARRLSRLLQRGDLVTFASKSVSSLDDNPSLNSTTRITHLIALLFGGHLSLEKKNIIKLDDWLRLELQSSRTLQRPAKLVVEFRKAMERFLARSFAGISHSPSFEDGESDMSASRGERKVSVAFKEDDPVRHALTEGLIQILDQDSLAQLLESEL